MNFIFNTFFLLSCLCLKVNNAASQIIFEFDEVTSKESNKMIVEYDNNVFTWHLDSYNYGTGKVLSKARYDRFYREAKPASSLSEMRNDTVITYYHFLIEVNEFNNFSNKVLRQITFVTYMNFRTKQYYYTGFGFPEGANEFEKCQNIFSVCILIKLAKSKTNYKNLIELIFKKHN